MQSRYAMSPGDADSVSALPTMAYSLPGYGWWKCRYSFRISSGVIQNIDSILCGRALACALSVESIYSNSNEESHRQSPRWAVPRQRAQEAEVMVRQHWQIWRLKREEIIGDWDSGIYMTINIMCRLTLLSPPYQISVEERAAHFGLRLADESLLCTGVYSCNFELIRGWSILRWHNGKKFHGVRIDFRVQLWRAKRWCNGIARVLFHS